LNDIFGMWRRRSALCLCGIGVLEPEKEEHPTTPQIVEVHQRQQHLNVAPPRQPAERIAAPAAGVVRNWGSGGYWD